MNIFASKSIKINFINVFYEQAAEMLLLFIVEKDKIFISLAWLMITTFIWMRIL